jgi:hypothetical protein
MSPATRKLARSVISIADRKQYGTVDDSGVLDRGDCRLLADFQWYIWETFNHANYGEKVRRGKTTYPHGRLFYIALCIGICLYGFIHLIR